VCIVVFSCSIPVLSLFSIAMMNHPQQQHGHDLQLSANHAGGFTSEHTSRRELDHLPFGSNNGMSGAMTPAVDNNGASGASESGGGTIQFLQDKLKQSSHPTVIVFHMLFKGVALFFYLTGDFWVGGNDKDGGRFITWAVICTLLLAADFWVVKNVTGRLLVGLRWWNKVQDEDTLWIFESAEDKVVNKFDRSVFWTVLYATPVVWAVLFVYGLITFEFSWLMIVVMAIALSMANVYGYYKCSKEQAVQFQQMMQAGAQQGAMAMIRSNMLSALTGTNASSNSQASSRNIV
jgi:Eukaryotic protein of unknown function (DUF846)